MNNWQEMFLNQGFGGKENIIGYRLNPGREWTVTGRYQLVEDDIYWQSSLEQRPREVKNERRGY